MSDTTLTTKAETARDVRGFWRVLLAVVAPVPMLFMGLYYLLSPVDGDAPFATTLAAVTADPGRFQLMQWLQVPFFLLIPAMFAAAWAARRTAPRLATAGGLLAVGGMSAGFFLLPGVVGPEYLVVHDGLDAATMEKFADATEKQPTEMIGGLLFILAVTFGLLLLGIALWRSRVAPAWMGIALAVGGFTHPFMPGHLAAGAGLVVAAIGFAGASIALLRSSNDAFDLPPLAR
ncbi:hypothetical protein [Kribbella monticola]|uniref:hypothetical protein n=1 Tax=Kribbella monticola TaxID=2185285 RepID=UPI000DD3DEAB|nr:hypothetical protein [Kribbella monticola]